MPLKGVKCPRPPPASSSALRTPNSPAYFPVAQVKLAISVLGIYGCYLTSGILQEHIYSYRSPDGGAR